MNQKVLGAARSVGYIFLFAIIGAVINAIPDTLTALPYVGQYVTPAISLALTAYLAMLEHQFADKVGYNLPAGTIKINDTSTLQ